MLPKKFSRKNKNHYGSDKYRSRLGVLNKESNGSFLIQPIERGQGRRIIAPSSIKNLQQGDLIRFQPVKNCLTRGQGSVEKMSFISKHGSVSGAKTFFKIAIHAHDIPHVFSEKALAQASALSPVDMNNREDWRHMPFVTIDPPDAMDRDDAVIAFPDTNKKNPEGMIIIAAIADVAAYVPFGSPLDLEALRRGNSVYFPDCVVPMLPERLSNNLCSLQAGEERPALAVRMIFDCEGHRIHHEFHRVMICVKENLSYQELQNASDGQPNDKTFPLQDCVVLPLVGAWKILKITRQLRQSLEIDLPESQIVFDKDGSIQNIFFPPRLESCKLIEEIMIQTNRSVAENLEHKKVPFIYRIHDAPSLAQIESLRSFSSSIRNSPTLQELNLAINLARGSQNEAIVSEIILRSQSRAVYSTENSGHFGLDLPSYTHFTSPIRRYADLTIHRALISTLDENLNECPSNELPDLKKIASLISISERRALIAERETIDRLIALFLSKDIGDIFHGYVSGVTKSGLFVRLSETGGDGFIPIKDLPGGYYVFDEKIHALYMKRRMTGYQLSDLVGVQLVEVFPLAREIRFKMLTKPKALQLKKREYIQG